MPRGGGGGGFRGGGGFSGGGSRGFSGGGSFRSSSFSRSSSFRGGSSFSSRSSSSRPFGRTGASRTYSSSSRRGPYSHSYYRPHNRYYGYRHYYRPWYGRRYWWYGHYYRPWYYTPAYWVSGTVVLIVFLLILLPLIGVAIAFPFNNTSTSGDINYRSTETLYFNEYWYEYEKLDAENTITYSMQSSGPVMSFAIADHPFEEFPTTTLSGSGNIAATMLYDEFQYYQLYLAPGSSITYNYSSDAPMDFMILNGDNFINWYYYDPYSYFVENDGVTSGAGTYSVTGYQDYYVVIYNPNAGTTVNANLDIEYVATGVWDLSSALVYEEAVTSVPQETISVPNSGDWYFFVFFDPFNSPDQEAQITFDVTYHTDVTSVDQWANARPTLVWILIIAGGILLFAIIARRKQKANKDRDAKKAQEAKTAAAQATTTTSSTSSPSSSPPPVSTTKSYVTTEKCTRCGTSLERDAEYCPNCGKKKEGRTFGVTAPATPVKKKYCNFCGTELPSDGKFCERCGTPIDR